MIQSWVLQNPIKIICHVAFWMLQNVLASDLFWSHLHVGYVIMKVQKVSQSQEIVFNFSGSKRKVQYQYVIMYICRWSWYKKFKQCTRLKKWLLYFILKFLTLTQKVQCPLFRNFYILSWNSLSRLIMVWSSNDFAICSGNHLSTVFQ